MIVQGLGLCNYGYHDLSKILGTNKILFEEVF